MKSRFSLLLFLLLLYVVPRASAQDNMYTADSYDDYGWYSNGAGGFTFYADATVEGQVFPQYAPAGAAHTYAVYTRLNGVPMEQSQGPTSNYVSLTNCQQADVTPGTEVNFNEEETVDCNYMGPVYDCEDDYQFPMVTVTQNYSGPLTGSVSLQGNYTVYTAVQSLGPLIAHGIAPGCAIGYATIGAVDPPDFVGNIGLSRTIANQSLYVNGQYVGGVPAGSDDTSQVEDTDPQASTPAGQVYDLDAPTLSRQDGTTDSYRTNFYTQAFLSDTGMPVSPPYNFYVRMSCKYTAQGYQFDGTVNGANQAGPGSTNLTYDGLN